MQFVSNHLRYTNMVARKEKRGTSFSEGVCLRIFSGYLLDSRNVLSKGNEGYLSDSRNRMSNEIVRYQVSRNVVQKKVPEGTCVRERMLVDSAVCRLLLVYDAAAKSTD